MTRCLALASMVVALGCTAPPGSVQAPMHPRTQERPTPAIVEVEAPVATPPTLGTWLTDEGTALGAARTMGAPVVVVFFAEWCAACKALERTMADAAVKDALRTFVCVRIDATDNDAPEVERVLTKYRVLGMPTVLVLDSRGKELGRMTEYLEPEAFITALRRSHPRGRPSSSRR